MCEIRESRKKIAAWILHAAVLFWAAFIFFFSLQNASASKDQSGGLLAFLQQFGFSFLTEHALRKIGHFTEFFVFGALLYAAAASARRAGILRPLRAVYPLVMLLVPVCDETLQYFSEGRSPEVKDVWLDFTGALAGAAAVLLLILLCGAIRRAAQNRNGEETKR